MILDNRTRYRSADLEAAILKALAEAGITSHARDRVLVNVSHFGFSGVCYLGGHLPPKLRGGVGRSPKMILRLPRIPDVPCDPGAPDPFARCGCPVHFDVGLFVWLVRHEVGHWRGLRHEQMAPGMRYRKLWLDSGRFLPDWAAEVSVGLEDAPPARRRKNPPEPGAEREKRTSHARKMLARAERRARLAETIAKKWRRRLASAERSILKAASRPSTDH